MENKFKPKKKIDYLGWTIFVILIASTTGISYQLQALRNDIKIQSISKVQVIDNNQLRKLCEQFKHQWKADSYAMYIYQPNSPVKTHQELASTDVININLRLPLTDYSLLNKNKIDFGSTEKLKGFHQNVRSYESYVRIPIYQYSVIVGEFYLFYDKTEQINSSIFESMIVESQIISQLLK
jgi:hypothetical protein